MKMKFNKGEKVLAVNSVSGKKVQITAPIDNMCKTLLTRYMVMHLGHPETDGWMFIKV